MSDDPPRGNMKRAKHASSGISRANEEILVVENSSGSDTDQTRTNSVTSKLTTLETLLDQERWSQARELIEIQLQSQPDNHWLLTQLASTYYEERQYRKSLSILKKSLSIVDDCPLTLWHFAGALSALGKHADAIACYKALIQSKVTAEDDPCWESEEWSRSLKADCLYRLGECYHKTKKYSLADRCLRRYIDLRLLGVEGIYSIDDAAQQIRKINGKSKQRHTSVQALLTI